MLIQNGLYIQNFQYEEYDDNGVQRIRLILDTQEKGLIEYWMVGDTRQTNSSILDFLKKAKVSWSEKKDNFGFLIHEYEERNYLFLKVIGDNPQVQIQVTGRKI